LSAILIDWENVPMATPTASNVRDNGLYASLPLLPNTSIRLLQLLPGSGSDPLKGDVFDYPIEASKAAPYEALSYTWGAEENPGVICINGREVRITRNLHSALSHLRYELLSRLIWIDAICINQDDEEEKAVQIPLMPQIYAKSLRVVVWLGEALGETPQALDLIRKVGMGYVIEPENHIAIHDLLRRSWFGRIWVCRR
jgi:hypothetical protein